VRILTFLLIAAAAFGTEIDSWAKVRELKGGLDVRIYKTGSTRALPAVLYSATADALIVVIRNEQVSVAKDDIDRLDYRPPQNGRSPKSKVTSSSETPMVKNGAAPVPREGSGNLNMSTTRELGLKPGFETIYKRPQPEETKR